MALPRLDKPPVMIVMPSTKRAARFRPMSRREEKLLLQAKESDDPLAWVEAVLQVVVNCAEDGFDAENTPSFDLEYAFVRLRAASIGSKETVSYRDPSDGKVYDVEIDLDRVEVVFPEGVSNVVEAGEGAKLQLRWPTAAAWADTNVVNAASPEDALDSLVAHCVDRVWVGDQAHDASTSSRDDVIDFLDSLDVQAWRGIRGWAAGVPHLSYWVEWTNSANNQRRVELRTLTDFFTFSSRGER